MLLLKPTCEHCNRELPANATDAMVCSFECTFCRTCVEGILQNVCPNCGGGFCPRPIRPARDLKNGNCLFRYPASRVVFHKPVDLEEHQSFAAAIAGIKPEHR